MAYQFALQVLFDFSDILEAIDFTSRNGFSALEVNLNNFLFYNQIAQKELRKKIKDFSKEKNLDLLFHAPEGLSFFLINEGATNFNLDFTKRLYDWLFELDAKIMTIHLGSDFTFGISGKKLSTYEVFPAVFNQHISSILRALKSFTNKTSNLKLCIENVGGFRYPFVLDLLEKYLDSHFALTLDIGHINRLKNEMREREIKFFEQNKEFIKACHLHDNLGEWDEHNIIGKGNINFSYFFNNLLKNSDCYLIFEVRPKEAALISYQNFIKLIGDEKG